MREFFLALARVESAVGAPPTAPGGPVTIEKEH
jgi:hypothetical protein